VVGEDSEITLPINARPQLQPERKFFLGPGARWLSILARPREQLSLDQVKAALAPAWTRRRVEQLPPNASAEARAAAQASSLDLRSGARGVSPLRSEFRRPLMVSMALVTLVLLIACVNIANLLLARTSMRRREIALRLAIGAGRERLLRWLLTESALLSAAGVAVGLAVAVLAARALVALLTGADAGVDVSHPALEVAFDWRMFAFTAGVAVSTTMLFGVIPALRGTRVAPAAAMNVSSMRIAAPRGRLALALVSSQVALSLLLLVGAGLFVRTLQNLRTLDRGFRHEEVLLAGIDPSRMPLARPAQKTFVFEALAFAERLPGVTAASLSSVTPLMGGGISQSITIDGQPAGSGELHFNNVGPRFFETLETPVVLGREFTPRDDAAAPPVAIVNEAFARSFIAGSPLGHRVAVGGQPVEMQIVGVVRDAVYESLREAPPPTVYAPFLQRGSGEATLVVHAPGAVGAVTTAIRNHLQPQLNGRPVRTRTLTAQLESSLTRERMMAAVAGIFGVLALLLAAVGLYGLLTYWVARRTHELGVRIALGARREHVVWLVLSDAVRMLAIGGAVGIAAAWALSRFVSTMLFGVTADDPATMTGAVAVLALTGLAAASLPARRATTINPMTALRTE
jgi:predicted permease